MGLTKQVITPGDGLNYPKRGDRLTMHYVGKLASNEMVFDSSVRKGRPFVFTIGIGAVIRGWDEGVMQMSLGEKSVLYLTSDLCYGKEGAGGVIPPNCDLNFEVQLLKIN
mmetsp:Transcript_14638/g.20819  ORF Transcript_14638/g.20819 Transcript_14638/m.20819 type:complete len:110 (-) Transcript_14638:18-347(-)